MWLKDPYDNYASREPENGESRQIPIYRHAPIPDMQNIEEMRRYTERSRRIREDLDFREEDIDPSESWDPEYLDSLSDSSHPDAHAEALTELRETLLAWQRGKEEIDQSLEDMAPNSSRKRRQLYRSQRELLDSLSPVAREIFADARDVVIGSTCFRCADNGEQIEVDSWSVLVL